MEWKNDLKQFESDNYSGSAALLELYIERMHYWLEKGELKSARDRIFLLDNVRNLEETHKSLLVFVHFYQQVIKVLNEDSENWNRDLLDFLRDYRLKWSRVNLNLARQALGVLELKQKTILSHSNSSAVKETLTCYGGNTKKIRIYQTESRPILEGRLQASALNDLGYEVILIPDTGYFRHLDQINMILLGADAVFHDYFVNKTGTYGICLAGKDTGIPIYVLADSRKLWFNLPPDRQDEEYNEVEKSGLEIWELPDPGLSVENYYFEKVPSSWVDGFITENEVLKPGQIEMMKT